MTDVGTWRWAERTGGRMSRLDQLNQIRQAAAARLGTIVRRSRSFGTSRAAIELPSPPDSALARAADEAVRELSSAALHAHCVRTWLFASAFAELDGIGHDPELLYLASVMHDVGLAEPYDGRDPTAHCFAVEGARGASALICEHGGSPELAGRAAEAISLHLNVNVDLEAGVEAHLLSRGVSVDAIGRYLNELPPQMVADVVAQWPRGDLVEELRPATRRQAGMRPRSRIALLNRIGFAGLVASNPLERDLEDLRG